MSVPPPSRTPAHPDARTTSKGEAASYLDMGDLLPRRRAPRILVVDDQPGIAGLMSQLLTMRGYDVTTASNAEQAEAEVRRQLPDLILSDVMMPGKSGYEFCRGLKENPATRLIPFVLITGLSDSSDKVRGIEAGADDFLNKPVLAEELIARVKSLLRLKEFTDELETADSVLCTLGLIVEGRDPYTEGHCERLSVRAADLGRHLGMDEDSLIALKRGGYLHDLGKIAVPDEILKKGSDLTPAEWLVMKHASHHRREHLQAAALAAAGAAHHPPPSRTLRWLGLSRWPDRFGNSGAPASPAGGGCVRRAAHRPLLQTCPRPTSRPPRPCARKPPAASGTRS